MTTLARAAERSPKNPTAQKKKTSAANTDVTLDLRDFGAVGDGETDDGPALQGALDALAAAGGGTLFVPAGRYAISTPVSEDFTGLASSVTILGVESDTPAPPPDADGQTLTRGLGLVSEFYPQTGDQRAAISVGGLQSFLVEHVAFVGTPDVLNDALVTIYIHDTGGATVRHCEFYGLSSIVEGGAIVEGVRSGLAVEQGVFLGSATSGGVYGSVVQNVEWKSIKVTDTVFTDYGQRPELFGKLSYGAPLSWVNVGNAAATDNENPRREATFRNVFFDEGGLSGISSLPARFQPPSATIDLLYITNLRMNVSNLGTSGLYLSGLRGAFVENSFHGWSHNADSAINLIGAGNAILDLVETAAAATRIRADETTARLVVINSTYEDLTSLAPDTVVVNTESPDDDPVQYVRARFQSALGRDPEAAAHFYWSDQILRCGDDAACVAARRAALDAYLAASPSPTFAITGRVLDENAESLAGVAVALSGSESVATETDADGQYHFAGLPTSGSYTVGVSKRHYTFDTPSQSFTTPAGDRSADFAGALDRRAISGVVVDQSNHPLASVTVTLSGSQDATATTGPDGLYSFTDLPAGGDYTVTPSSERYTFAPAPQTFSDLSADQWSSFMGTPLFHSVGGRVSDINNGGIAGVTVALSGSRTATTTTDASGNFLFADLPLGGSYTVTPSLRFYVFDSASKTFNNLSADGYAVFVVTPALHSIAGRITEH
ncbi:MAG: hypothetical protein DMF65_02500, partial [Acidobacteria bacterium]